MQLKTISIDSVENTVLQIPVRMANDSIENKQLEVERYLHGLSHDGVDFASITPTLLHVFAVRGRPVDLDPPEMATRRRSVSFNTSPANVALSSNFA